MSYFTLPMLTFSGQFQADVSTVNNDVRHYDNTSFQPRFQDEQVAGTQILNGWWNPDGTGAFRLVDVQVKTALTAPGENHPDDKVIGLYLNAQVDRTAAKLVDLDPQWQNASAIFGLRVVLTDGTTDYMTANYKWSAFRDIYFGRILERSADGAASAKFSSMLTDVTFTDAAMDSPMLMQLCDHARANQDRLAINFMTYAYGTFVSYGLMCGSIGPWTDGDPEMFAPSRRLANAKAPSFGNTYALGYADSWIENGVASVDLSASWQMDKATLPVLQSSGRVKVGILKQPDTIKDGVVTTALNEGDAITADDIAVLGEIPYLSVKGAADLAEKEGRSVDETLGDYWNIHSGISQFNLTPEAHELVQASGPDQGYPIAVVVMSDETDTGAVLLREANGGLFVRADQFLFRMDPLREADPKDPSQTVDTPAKDVVSLKAYQWGKPLAGADLELSWSGAMPGQGGGYNNAHSPQAKIPVLNIPQDKIGFAAKVTTDAQGWAASEIIGYTPGNPRKYIDGQLYLLNYDFATKNTSPMHMFDNIVAYVRDAVLVKDVPSWKDDIEPFMIQYDNLYPIMSKGLFRMSDQSVAKQHATLLTLAFNRPFDDPNHMPATRDMSVGRRQMVLNWLAAQTGTDAPNAAEASAHPGPVEAKPVSAETRSESTLQVETIPIELIKEMLSTLGTAFDGKSAATRTYLQGLIDQMEQGEPAALKKRIQAQQEAK